MHLRLQPGPGDGGKCPLAAVRPVRSGPERQGDQGPADEQVQGLRLRHDDQLRRGRRCRPVPQRVHPRQPGTTGQLQDEQHQVENELKLGKILSLYSSHYIRFFEDESHVNAAHICNPRPPPSPTHSFPVKNTHKHGHTLSTHFPRNDFKRHLFLI